MSSGTRTSLTPSRMPPTVKHCLVGSCTTSPISGCVDLKIEPISSTLFLKRSTCLSSILASIQRWGMRKLEAAVHSVAPEQLASCDMSSGFFPDHVDEDDLEARNEVFWTAMIDQIRRDGFVQPPRRVLDVGCHRGGLLANIAKRWNPDELIGLEPIEEARDRARFRLAALTRKVVLLHPTEWQRISDGAVDLVVCHEVLFL